MFPLLHSSNLQLFLIIKSVTCESSRFLKVFPVGAIIFFRLGGRMGFLLPIVNFNHFFPFSTSGFSTTDPLNEIPSDLICFKTSLLQYSPDLYIQMFSDLTYWRTLKNTDAQVSPRNSDVASTEYQDSQKLPR